MVNKIAFRSTFNKLLDLFKCREKILSILAFKFECFIQNSFCEGNLNSLKYGHPS